MQKPKKILFKIFFFCKYNISILSGLFDFIVNYWVGGSDWSNQNSYSYHIVPSWRTSDGKSYDQIPFWSNDKTSK